MMKEEAVPKAKEEAEPNANAKEEAAPPKGKEEAEETEQKAKEEQKGTKEAAEQKAKESPQHEAGHAEQLQKAKDEAKPNASPTLIAARSSMPHCPVCRSRTILNGSDAWCAQCLWWV